MYVTLGAPGSGKSYYVKHTNPLSKMEIVESDQVRDLVEGYITKYDEETGSTYNTHDTTYEKQTWKVIWDSVERKMKTGTTFVLDSTFLFKGAFQTLKHLRDRYNYRVYVLDFTGVSLDDLTYQNRSLERVENKAVVPDNVILRMYKKAQTVNIPTWANRIDMSDEDADYQVEKTTMWRFVDMSEYEHIKIIGDIHGANTVLQEALGTLQEDTLYIFLGDYMDRGLENDKVFEFMYAHKDDSNFVLLRGNHERHLANFAYGEPTNSLGRVFREETLPQLMRAGFTKDQFKKFTKKLVDVFAFIYNGSPYICSHAGLLAEDALELYRGYGALLGQKNLVDGVNKFDNNVDKIYASSGLKPTQFHGHRNEFGVEINAYPDQIYNLEQKVESGLYLGVADVDNSGIHTQLYKNNHSNPIYAEDNLNLDLSKLDTKDIARVFNHSRNIRVKKVDDNLYANNFTSEAFRGNKFDSFSIQARGLFTDKDGNVKARGFKKFFNINQTPETSYDNVLKMKLPVRVSVKIDGFLAIMSVVDGKLKILSKGGDPNFNNEAHSIIMKNTHKTEAQIVDYLKDKNLSIVCEIVSHRDSHPISYAKEEPWVLEAIENEYTEYDSETEADNFAYFTGLNRPSWFEIRQPEALRSFVDKALDMHQDGLEGFVLTDKTGFRTKIKIASYLEDKWLFQQIHHKINKSDYQLNTQDPRFTDNPELLAKFKRVLDRVNFGDDVAKAPMGFADYGALRDKYFD